jgi:hypothetical protein
MDHLEARKHEVCERYGSPFIVTSPDVKVGIKMPRKLWSR